MALTRAPCCTGAGAASARAWLANRIVTLPIRMVNAMFTFAATAQSELSPAGTPWPATLTDFPRLPRQHRFANGPLLPPRDGQGRPMI
jgi:hypothetical protein